MLQKPAFRARLTVNTEFCADSLGAFLHDFKLQMVRCNQFAISARVPDCIVEYSKEECEALAKRQ